MTLGVYVDASGPSDDVPAVTVAAVIAKTDAWEAFTEEWLEAMADFENLPYFHMTDFESGWGNYGDWTERGVKKPRLDRLLTIMEEHIMAICGATVSLEDCAASDAWDASKPIELAYRLTASQCLNAIPQYRYLQDNPGESVLYTFEAGDGGFGKLAATYDDIYRTEWRRVYSRLIDGPQVEGKMEPPLQAADIIAFEGRKQWAREFGGDLRNMRYPFARLRNTVTSEWATLHLTSIDSFVAELELPPLAKTAYRSHFRALGVERFPVAPLTLPTWG